MLYQKRTVVVSKENDISNIFGIINYKSMLSGVGMLMTLIGCLLKAGWFPGEEKGNSSLK